jgi:cytochrome c-type biogenesis protein CcmH
MALAEELRCLVCQNQTLADSHAALAIDLKNRIRELLREGKTEREVLDFMVQRYGDFVLYRPPLRATTALLWAGPFILLVLGVTGLIAWLRKRKTLEAEVSQ